MSRFYKIVDVLLIILRGNNEVGDTILGKMHMYMSAGKTILKDGTIEIVEKAH